MPFSLMHDDDPRMAVQPRPLRAIPYDFVLETLASIRPHTHPMFGCLAVYVGDKIMLALRRRESAPQDNGVWLATTCDHHASLKREFPAMRSISVLGSGVTGWQILPEQADDFEESVLRACRLILNRDPRIGKVPKKKRENVDRRKSHG